MGRRVERRLLVLRHRQRPDVVPCERAGLEDPVDRLRRVAVECPGDALQHLADRRRQDRRRFPLVKALQRRPELLHRGAALRDGGVPRLAPDRHLQAAGALLGDLAGVEELPGDLHRVAAALVDREFGVDQVLVVFPDIPGAVGAAGLLVGEGDEDEVARQGNAGFLDRDERGQLGGDLPLHVDGAASPDEVVDEIPGERVALPLVRLNGDHVDMTHQQDGPAGRVLRLQPGDHADAARRALHELRLDPGLGEGVADVLRRADLVAWRALCIAANQLLQVADGGLAKG